MTIKYNSGLKTHARALRQGMTDAEQILWSKLRRKQIHGVQFYRQKPLGCYIVDFYAPGAKLVIELDGSQHSEQIARVVNERVNLEQKQKANPPQPPFCKGGSENASTSEGGEDVSMLGGCKNIPPFAKGGLGGISALSDSLRNAKKTDTAK